MLTFEPGTGENWAIAWTLEGTCSGTIAPTSSPSYESLEDVGGCPPAFSEDTEEFASGEEVSVCSDPGVCLVYKCKNASPDVGEYCDMLTFEPGTGENWAIAWTLEGTCSGTGAPTPSPSLDPFESLGSCEELYSNYADQNSTGTGEPGDGSTVDGESTWSWGIHTTYAAGKPHVSNSFVWIGLDLPASNVICDRSR